MLPNTFRNPPPEVEELQFLAQRLKLDCIFYPDFCRRPSTATRNNRNGASEVRDRTSQGFSVSL
jgi:hypothetical protein